MPNQKGRDGKAQKQYYSSYNYEKNRKLRLQRHLNKHPEDEQAKAAMKNIHHRGPRPSNNKMGWIDRSMTLQGFNMNKKDDYSLLYADVNGPKDAKERAQMAAHVRRIERMRQNGHDFGLEGVKRKKKSKKYGLPE